TGMDYSEVSVAESQKLNAYAIKQGKCSVVQGDVSAIPFPDAAFDYVSAFETVYFWPGLAKCFTEIKTYSNIKNHWISIVATK
ncbi:class I SAM-dependent methyltransferase, partial [Catenibacterium sp.]|uniref:class I SAM-dependent methyltransferase n=1 Tax=Catenibacterium sp. TaxID=2049022 RepID=UPI003FD7EA79